MWVKEKMRVASIFFFSHNVFNPIKDKKKITILVNFILWYANVFNLDQIRILLFGKDLHCNSLPNNNILDWTKLKAFADDKLNLTKNLKLVLGRVENIVGKGENAGDQHFLLFQ